MRKYMDQSCPEKLLDVYEFLNTVRDQLFKDKEDHPKFEYIRYMLVEYEPLFLEHSERQFKDRIDRIMVD